jgi:hypothetical protein
MRPQPGRRSAALALLALALAGCGTPTAAVGRIDDAPLPAPQAHPAPSLPVELVGTWAGVDAQGLGSWTLVFDADGGYHESNTRRGIAVDGEAAVAGRRLYLQPDRADSQTVTWEVSGAVLSLDGTLYRRAAALSPAGGR